MMVITICSFVLNFPGFRLQVYPKVVNLRVGRTFSKNLPAGKPLYTAYRKSSVAESEAGENVQQLGDVGANADTRVANAEELVDKTTRSDEGRADNPGTECTGRHVRVIVVVDDSADLGIGRVLDGSCQASGRVVRTI